MDPNETLREIKALTAKHETDGGLDGHDTARLVELIDALDGWLTARGFLPAAWAEGR